MHGPGPESQRTIVDRRTVAERLAGVNDESEAGAVLRDALEAGRAEIARRLAAEPSDGRAAASATAFLHDQLVRLAFDFVMERSANQQAGGDLALVGLGGTGRGEMAPHSDLDLMFLTAKAPTAGQEKIAEAVLHLLWALKIKIGHSIRSIDQLVALTKSDLTIRTAVLEAR